MLDRRQLGLSAASSGVLGRYAGRTAAAVAGGSSGRLTAALAGGKVLISGSVQGRTIGAVIDSGATLSVWNIRRPTQDAPKTSVRALTSSVALERVPLDGLTLGALRFSTLDVLAADLRPVELASGERIDLVIGQDLLALFELHIALAASPPFVEFGPPGRRDGGPSEELELHSGEAGTLVVECSLSARSAKGLVDLGSDAAVYVSQRWLDDKLVRPQRPASLSMSAGVEGRQVHTICTLPSLQVGSRILPDVPAIVLENWRHDYDLVIGLPVWRRFDQWLDVANRKIRLRPADTISPFERNRSGISAERLGGRLRIAFVAPDSPAAEAGLRAGDQVVAIDDKPLDAAFFMRRPRPGGEAAGTVERLTLATGETKVITLRDYY